MRKLNEKMDKKVDDIKVVNDKINFSDFENNIAEIQIMLDHLKDPNKIKHLNLFVENLDVINKNISKINTSCEDFIKLGYKYGLGKY